MGTVVSFEEKRKARILTRLEELNPGNTPRLDPAELEGYRQYKGQLAYCTQRLARLKIEFVGPYKKTPNEVTVEIDVLEGAIKLLRFYIQRCEREQ